MIHDEINIYCKNKDWRHTHMHPYELIRLWVIAEEFPSFLLRELEEETAPDQ